MTDQLRISNDGRIECEPVTWDGEPVYSVETVREAAAAGMPLFDPAAFEQIPGQLAMSEPRYAVEPVEDGWAVVDATGEALATYRVFECARDDALRLNHGR